MAEDKRENVQPIFLNDGSILPWNSGERLSMLGYYNGSTTLTGFLDFQDIRENVGAYKVLASAAIYSADIIHLIPGTRGMKNPWENVTGELRKEILFVGGMSIYRKGAMLGTELEGRHHITNGDIWCALPADDTVATGIDQLWHLVLGSHPGEEARRRIEGIVEGYRLQEEGRKENRAKAESEMFERGVETGEHNERRR